MSLAYLIDRIEAASPKKKPFRHLQVKNFLKPHHFEEIINDERLVIKETTSDRELSEILKSKGYVPSWLPGSTSDVEQYLDNRENKKVNISKNPTCDTIGVAYRLTTVRKGSQETLLDELLYILKSDDFWDMLIKKVKVKHSDYTRYVAYTKYLDGHEISPHTDSRHKPLTFLLNMNPPHLRLEKKNHTALMKLRKEYNYIIDYWKHNKNVDRCWLPWQWAKVYNYHSANNSLLVIPATNKSFHSIKLEYNHLIAQRSLIYGSIWNTKEKVYDCPLWQDLQIQSSNSRLINATTCKQWKSELR
jgi:hypothetical protein